MDVKYFSFIRNYVLSVSSQRKYNFYLQNKLLDAFRTNSRNIIGRNPSMVIPLLANQDLTPMLFYPQPTSVTPLYCTLWKADNSNWLSAPDLLCLPFNIIVFVVLQIKMLFFG